MKQLSAPKLSPDLLLASHEVHGWRHWLRIIVFLALFFCSASISVFASTHLTVAWQYVLLIPFYLLSAASLHGISLFTHEAVHGTLSGNRILNDVLGAVCAFPVLQTCSAYRVLHLKHHRHLGDQGDPDHYENYTQWTWMVFIMNWLRLLVGYPVYLIAIPILGFRQGTTRDRLFISLEVIVLGILVSVVWFSPIPRSWLLHGWLIPMLLINTMVNIRGMSQHTLLENSADQVHGTRTILTNRVVRFFMCNENFHLEHHLCPGVPWHGLPAVHEALRPELIQQGAPYISSYAAFVREFFRDSLKRSPLGRRQPPLEV